MDLTALCDVWNYNWHKLMPLSFERAFVCHFVAAYYTHLPPLQLYEPVLTIWSNCCFVLV